MWAAQEGAPYIRESNGAVTVSDAKDASMKLGHVPTAETWHSLSMVEFNGKLMDL